MEYYDEELSAPLIVERLLEKLKTPVTFQLQEELLVKGGSLISTTAGKLLVEWLDYGIAGVEGMPGMGPNKLKARAQRLEKLEKAKKGLEKVNVRLNLSDQGPVS